MRLNILFISLITLYIASVLTIHTNTLGSLIYNILDATIILEIALFSYVILSLKSLHKSHVFSVLTLITLVIYALVKSYLIDIIKYNDIIISHKNIIYLIYGYLIVTIHKDDNKIINKLSTITLYVFFVKYTICKIIIGIDRPGVFTENNFELVFLTLTMLIILKSDKHRFNKYLLIYIIVVLISGSRSGILMAISLSTYYVVFLLNAKNIYKIKFLSVVFILSMIVISSRLPGLDISAIDRFRFLLSFLDDMAHSEFYVWLIGNDILTPISLESSNALRAYPLLFSDFDNRIAYSVLFHSALMRIIYDFGVIGLTLNLTVIWQLTNYKLKDRHTANIVVLILIVNGLSVSSFYSTYFALGWMLLLSYNYKIETNVYRVNFPKKAN